MNSDLTERCLALISQNRAYDAVTIVAKEMKWNRATSNAYVSGIKASYEHFKRQINAMEEVLGSLNK